MGNILLNKGLLILLLLSSGSFHAFGISGSYRSVINDHALCYGTSARIYLCLYK